MVSESLEKFVLGRGSITHCDHCGNECSAVDDEILASHIEALFETVLVPFDELPEMVRTELFCGADHPLREVSDHIDFNLPTHSDAFNNFLVERLEQEFVASDASSVDKCFMVNDGKFTDNEFTWKWLRFLSSVRSEHRFFNRSAKEFLDELFHIFLDDYDLEKPSVVAEFGWDIPLYRARIASSIGVLRDIQASPARQLGAPPANIASDQRMSPAGISVFYAATDRGTCISEIRPLVGDFAVSGEFRPLRKLKLLDLNKLPECQSVEDIYAENYVQHAHAVVFFKELVFQMSRPARRSEGHPYLPTQFIFEYLRVKFGDMVDGIVYSSVQQDQQGPCVALFPEKGGVADEAVCQWHLTEDIFGEERQDSLFFVPESLRYHRVRGVSYAQDEDENDFLLTASDDLLELVGSRF
ncbi:RES family NAD+ phosphorylase [uncultured Spongiibacter sp.]|uniref:RES family NAD+ phosphorylase n=1 Tax=uncultured Spongiibacter sp. TaxID=870896 RepID=UPI00258678AB|nr:RES family NAD+ phosphorylase [uncultured Spongiibacter sp.]